MTKKNIKTIFDTKLIDIEPKIQGLIFTNLQKYIKSDSKVLSTVSGGADSMLLSLIIYDFFIKNNFDTNKLFFIHLNHQTRKANHKDQIFIKRFFNGTNLTIKTRKNSLKATENNLRNRRYKQIKQISQKHDIDFILFGHNLTDRIESSFMNMLRGCSIKGLQSMSLIQSHHLLEKTIIRPLIFLTKNQITQICKQNNIPFVQDETNKDIQTSLRNKIRLKLFPQIFKLSNKQDKLSNSFIQSFQNIYDFLDQPKSQENLLKDITKSPYWNCKFGYELNIFKKLITQDHLVQIMKNLGIYKNINNKFIQELKDFLINKENGFKYFNQTYFFVSHNKIYIINAPKNFWKKNIDKKITINNIGDIKLGKLNIPISQKQFIGSILRFAKKGDKFKNKTRNQYCSTQKIPIFRRNFVPIVQKNGQIIHSFKDIYNL